MLEKVLINTSGLDENSVLLTVLNGSLSWYLICLKLPELSGFIVPDAIALASEYTNGSSCVNGSDGG